MKEQPINVTTLAWEPPKPRETLPFDPERDITEEDWSKMTRYLEEAREEIRQEGVAPQQRAEDAYLYVIRLASAMILSPERFRQFSRATHILELLLENQLAHFINQNDYDAIVTCASNYKLAFAKTSAELGINDELRSKIFAECLMMRGHQSFLELFPRAVILDPQFLSRLGLDENDWYTAHHDVQEAQWSDLQTQAGILARAKLVFPEKVSGFTDQTFWRNAKRTLQTYRQESLGRFFILAGSLAILAAQKVSITDQGIELVFDRSEPFTAPTPPMPVMRKF